MSKVSAEPTDKAIPTFEDAAAIDAILEELAALGEIAYGRRRKGEADRLGIPVSFLDSAVKKRRRISNGYAGELGNGQAIEFRDPEPWPEPVDGDTLLGQIVATFKRHVALPDGAVEALALWSVHTHAFKLRYFTPRLGLKSPLPECGKTTTLDVVACLSAKAQSTDNVSPAFLFRVIELAQPMLVIDDLDSFLKKDSEVINILNSGHRRGGYVGRTVGDSHEPRIFLTFAPIALGYIGRLPSRALESRCITIEMRRRLPSENVVPLRLDLPSHRAHLDELSSMICRFVRDHAQAITSAEPEMPEVLSDRARDNWRPLLAIADISGADWPERARRAAITLSNVNFDDRSEIKELVLADIKAIFSELDSDRIASIELCEKLAAMEERPWPEWRNGKPITPRQLAALLKGLGSSPGTIKLVTGKTTKGYLRSAFDDAFARYLPLSSVTPSPSAENRLVRDQPK